VIPAARPVSALVAEFHAEVDPVNNHVGRTETEGGLVHGNLAGGAGDRGLDAGGGDARLVARPNDAGKVEEIVADVSAEPGRDDVTHLHVDFRDESDTIPTMRALIERGAEQAASHGRSIGQGTRTGDVHRLVHDAKCGLGAEVEEETTDVHIQVNPHLRPIEEIVSLDRVISGKTERRWEVGEGAARRSSDDSTRIHESRRLEELDRIMDVQILVKVKVAKADQATHRAERWRSATEISFPTPYSCG